MCVIIINQTKSKVSAATLQKAATINADGLGIIWLDDYSIEYHESSEFMRLHTERPFCFTTELSKGLVMTRSVTPRYSLRLLVALLERSGLREC